MEQIWNDYIVLSMQKNIFNLWLIMNDNQRVWSAVW